MSLPILKSTRNASGSGRERSVQSSWMACPNVGHPQKSERRPSEKTTFLHGLSQFPPATPAQQGGASHKLRECTKSGCDEKMQCFGGIQRFMTIPSIRPEN